MFTKLYNSDAQASETTMTLLSDLRKVNLNNDISMRSICCGALDAKF